MNTYLVSLLLAFLVCAGLTPVVLHFANRRGLVDAAGVSHRKVHAQDIPRLGGIAIVLGFYAPFSALMIYETFVGRIVMEQEQLVWGLLVGGLVISLLGLFDDLYGASPKTKLVVQVITASGLVAFGFEIERVDLPVLSTIELGWLSWPMTILWIVGITNAVNLIDGLDGLAAGMALFGLAPMTVIALYSGSVALTLVCFTLTGSVLGFLVFNFHPARIFMGDMGSMFLGFILAIVTVHTSVKGGAAVSMMVPVLALGLPILDTMLALARRAWVGQSLFAGDRQHIHHRLLAMGLSHRRAVLVMYGFAALFAALALATTMNRDFTGGIVLGLSSLVAGILLRKIGYLTMPSALGEQLELASILRERNRILRGSIQVIQEHVDKAVQFEQIIPLAGELAMMVSARSARLDLTPAFPHEPIRSWAWGDPSISEEDWSLSFPLSGPSGPLGELTLVWEDERVSDESVIQTIEAGCARLAVRLDAHRADDSETRVS